MPAEPRAVGLPLMAGLVAVPIVFVWLLLRPGFARSTRVAAFTYAFGPASIVLAMRIVAALAGT